MFIGQKHIIAQLDFIIPVLQGGENLNLFMRGPSGYGKTTLGFKICNMLAPDRRFTFIIPKGGDIELRLDKRVIFIDEIHTLASPEFLYPIMDSGKFVFIIATNEDGNVKEPLMNRCVPLIFTEYSQEELREIVKIPYTTPVSDDILDKVIDLGGRNPRQISSLSRRLSMYERVYGRIEDFDSVLENIFGYKDGLDELSRTYLRKLSELGGRASVEALARALHVDQNTIKYIVEPNLLYKNKITISQRGRCLNENQ